MSPDERREQLLDIGERTFTEQAYDDVLLDDVAARAGVSRRLLYHYFPTKREFFAAVFLRASRQLSASVRVDPDRPLAEQVAAGLDAYIDWFVQNPHSALAVNHGSLSADPLIQGIIAEDLARLQQEMLDASGLTGPDRQLAAIAIQAWLAYVRAACTTWLDHPSIPRSTLHTLCLQALILPPAP
jgi:AcrR family transcriptional regulator